MTFDPPKNHCPKCIAPHPEGALICARCGLAFANFVPELVAPRPELAEAWRALHGRWGDAAAHEQLILRASSWGALAELGRLYRIRLVVAPDDARALAGRERIISLAAQASLPKRPPGGGAPEKTSARTVSYVLFAILAIGIIGLLWRMVVR